MAVLAWVVLRALVGVVTVASAMPVADLAAATEALVATLAVDSAGMVVVLGVMAAVEMEVAGTAAEAEEAMVGAPEMAAVGGGVAVAIMPMAARSMTTVCSKDSKTAAKPTTMTVAAMRVPRPPHPILARLTLLYVKQAGLLLPRLWLRPQGGPHSSMYLRILGRIVLPA